MTSSNLVSLSLISPEKSPKVRQKYGCFDDDKRSMSNPRLFGTAILLAFSIAVLSSISLGTLRQLSCRTVIPDCANIRPDSHPMRK